MSFIGGAQKIWNSYSWWQWTVIAGAAACLLWLIGLSFFVRPAADDYCSYIDIQNIGIANYLPYYYSGLNGRLASGLLNILVYGSQAQAALIGLAIINILLFVGAIFYFLESHYWVTKKLLSLAVVTLVAVLIFSLLSDKYQLIMWSPGIISYTLPFSLLLVLFGWLARRPRGWLSYVAVGLGGLFFGLANELLAVYGIGLAILYWLLFRGGKRALSGRQLGLYAVTQLVAFMIIYFSPGSISRRSAAASGGHLSALATSSYDMLHIILQNLFTTKAFVGVLLIGIVAAVVWQKELDRQRLRLQAAWLLIGGLSCLYGASFISFYSYRIGPAGRMTFLGIILLVSGLLIAATYGSLYILQRLSLNMRFKNLLTLGCLAVVLVINGMFLRLYSHDVIGRYRVWSEQDRVLSRPGIESRQVYASLPVYQLDGVGDIEHAQKNWVETCQQYYYD